MRSTSSTAPSSASRVFAPAIIAIAFALAACTSDNSTETLVPSALGIVTGNGQTAIAGAVVTNPFVVEVLDQNAEGMKGVIVNWTIVSGGGSLSTTAAATDSAGLATSRYTAGPVATTASIRANVNGIPNPVIFTVTITPGGASRREE